MWQVSFIHWIFFYMWSWGNYLTSVMQSCVWNVKGKNRTTHFSLLSEWCVWVCVHWSTLPKACFKVTITDIETLSSFRWSLVINRLHCARMEEGPGGRRARSDLSVLSARPLSQEVLHPSLPSFLPRAVISHPGCSDPPLSSLSQGGGGDQWQ